MKKIYVFGVYSNTSILTSFGDIVGFAVDKLVVDQGKLVMNVIVDHLSSNEFWCQHDMGITSDWKHDIYDAAYPNGYELVWLGCFSDMKDAYETVKKLLQEVEE